MVVDDVPFPIERLGRVGRATLGVAVFCVTLGFALMMGWVAVRFAGAHDSPPYSDQPAPSWLPRAAIGFVVAGSVLCLVALIASRRKRDSARGPFSETAAQWIAGPAAVLGLVVAAAVSVDSAYRWRPLLLGALVLVVPWWLTRGDD